MRKIIVYSLLIVILAINFAQAQESDKRPEIDFILARIANTLDSILSNEFQKLNLSASRFLEDQFQQIADKVDVDSLKVKQYLETSAEVEKFLKKREEKVNSLVVYNEAIEEAEIAGAYLGLQDFINTLGDCLNPRIRNELSKYLMKITQEFNLSLKAEELLNSIPDCPSKETTTTLTLKPNFFAWLTQPFKLNLAQIKRISVEKEIPPLTITSAFQDTEDTIELKDLQFRALTLLHNSADNKKEERKKEIGKTWPVERCIEQIIDKNINEGKPLCLRYLTLISGEDIEQFKKELALNNPLTNATSNINVYEGLAKPESVLKQAGIKTLIISTSSEKIKKIVDQICASYKSDEGEDNLTSAYALCLKQFNDELKKTIEIQQQKVKEQKNEVEAVKNKIEEVKEKARELKDKIDLNVCPGAFSDLEGITLELEAKAIFYTGLINELSKISAQFTSLISAIDNLSFQIKDLLNQGLSTSADALIVDPLSKLIAKFNQLSYHLYQDEASNLSFLNDLYELEVILQKLDAYKRAILKDQCSPERKSLSNKVSLIKNQVVIVESINKKNKSFNFFVLLKNLFGPKIVEIRNEK